MLSGATAHCTCLDADAAHALVERALAEGRVALAFQPVVGGGPSPSVAFYEGLIRVLDEDGSVVPAGMFIQAVEEGELGRELDRASLRLGLAALAADPGLRLSINMAVRTIGDAAWIGCLEAAAAADPTVVERLIVEVTERAVLVSRDVAAFMARLRQLGVAFALDDFGAGYSSFRNLRELRFDILKIDGGFIRGIDADAGSQVMMQALMLIADHFETLSVAECVETAEEAETLQRLGVDCLQGWLYGRPEMTRPGPAAQEQARLAV